MHYAELDDRQQLLAIRPLEGEQAGTEFYNGVLFLIPAHFPEKEFIDSLAACSRLFDNPAEELERFVKAYPALWEKAADRPLSAYLFGRMHPAAELGANNGGGNCHVQRL